MNLLLDEVENLLPSSSPWETLGGHDELATVMFLRGAILGSYGFIETKLSEIAIRSSRIGEYSRLQSKFPWKTADRLKYLSRAFDLEGVLKNHAPLGKKLVDDFAAVQVHRNKWAHGSLSVLPGSANDRWGGAWITLTNINPGHDQLDVTTDRWTKDQIIGQAIEAKQLADRTNAIHCLLTNVLPPA